MAKTIARPLVDVGTVSLLPTVKGGEFCPISPFLAVANDLKMTTASLGPDMLRLNLVFPFFLPPLLSPPLPIGCGSPFLQALPPGALQPLPKRPALEKNNGATTVFSPSVFHYQQALANMQLQQPAFIPTGKVPCLGLFALLSRREWTPSVSSRGHRGTLQRAQLLPRAAVHDPAMSLRFAGAA